MDSSVFEFGLVLVHYLKKGCQIDKNKKQNAKQCSEKTEKANSVDPDEMAHYEPSHLDLHCLQSLFSGL